MDELVERLSKGEHDVVIPLRPEPSMDAFRERLDVGFIYVKFTGTRGGTELGIDLDTGTVDLHEADLEAGSGRVRIEGDLTLNYENVRCIAEIDLPSFSGKGRLVPQAG